MAITASASAMFAATATAQSASASALAQESSAKGRWLSSSPPGVLVGGATAPTAFAKAAALSPIKRRPPPRHCGCGDNRTHTPTDTAKLWLRQAKCKWYAPYACTFGGNKCRQKQLDDLPPPPTQQEMALLPGSHILFYGFSYLLEAVLALACYAGPVVVRTNLLRCPPTATFGDDACNPSDHGSYTMYHFKASNVTLVAVTNYALLQSSYRLHNLRRFLEYESFDAAVMLQPHADCFLEWRVNKTLPKCVNLSAIGKEMSSSSKHERISSIFRDYFGPQGYVELRPWARVLYPNSSAEDLVDSEPIVSKHACCVGCGCQCQNSVGYHQCAPGTPDLVARDLVTRLNGVLIRRELSRQRRGPSESSGGSQPHPQRMPPRRYTGTPSTELFGRSGVPPWVWRETCDDDDVDAFRSAVADGTSGGSELKSCGGDLRAVAWGWQ